MMIPVIFVRICVFLNYYYFYLILCFSLNIFILNIFANQIDKMDKTQVKQTYEVFSNFMFNSYVLFCLARFYLISTVWKI